MAGHARPQGQFTDRQEPGFEPRDTNIRLVIRFGVGLVLLLVVLQLVLLGSYRYFLRQREPAAREPRPTNLTEQLKSLRAEEDAALGGYGKVEGEPGYARIPIDRAMDLMVKKGVPFGKGQKTEVEVNTRVKQ